MKHRIRLVHVVWRLSVGGGIPQVSRQVLAGLDPERFDCHAIIARPAWEEDRLDELGPNLTVHALDHEGPARPRDEIRLGLRIASRVRELRPDVLHAHSGTARLSLPSALGSPGTPRVLEVHEPLKDGLHSRLTNGIEVGMVKAAGFRPFAHSTHVRDATAAIVGWRPERIPLVPLGVPVHVPDPAAGLALRAELGIPREALVVVGVGRATQKNIPLMVRVGADVVRKLGDAGPPVVFLVIGRQEPEIPALIQELGVGKHVRVVPPLARLSDAFDAADLFLSTSHYEGFGLAVAEAMMAGVPVVGTAVGGVTDVVADGVTGRLLRAGDRGGLVMACRELLTNNALRTQMGAASRERALARFTRQHMLDGFAQVYERAALRRRQ
ncbi:glycosyltransferase family 4 protein [Embleya sp. NPDC005575]|uniref:glycosyltransferase family 4 protein n=1 Tax=Embleya sp. NPDC005575 TaxID=3156892 RepID=UPI0033AA70DD